MKKALFIFMALALITPMIFATGPTPEVTFGVSAELEVQALKENTTDTYKVSGDGDTPEAKFNPYGAKNGKFVSNQWVNFDWDLMSIKADAKYDAFRASDDDFSWLKVTATWKDLFGFRVDYTYAYDNEEGTKDPAATLEKNQKNEVALTYDHLEDNGVKFWTKYNAGVLSNAYLLAPGAIFNDVMNSFTEIGFEYDSDEIATKLVYKNDITNKEGDIKDATIEAKNMFGIWTVLLNDADEIGYRVADLDSDSSIDRPGFKIGDGNKIQYIKHKEDGVDVVDVSRKAMNAKNTFAIGDNLVVKATAVVPNADVTLLDWLKGDNLLIGAEFALDGVGTLGAGAKVSNDYKVNETGDFSGPTKILTAVADAMDSSNFQDPNNPTLDEIEKAMKAMSKVQWGNAFWFDAKLDQLLGDSMAAFAGVDAQFGQYYQIDKTEGKADKVEEMKVGTATKMNLYGEFTADLSDALSVSAGVLYSLGFGYDYKAVTGSSWSDDNKKNTDTTFYSGFSEANVANAEIYGITPFELKARVDFKVNDDISVWASDNFVLNAGWYDERKDDGTRKYDTFTSTNAKAINDHAFFQKNTIGLGAKFKATEKSSLTVSTDINLYLGLPSASDLESKDMTDGQKDALKSGLAEWKSKNFNPFTLKVAYKYAY